MKILAIEASGLVAGCALLEDGLLVADYSIQYKKTHSQSLVPMLDGIRRMVELDLATVDAVALTAGPGSFTGLRIAAATAKGLGLALDIPLIAVPTVDAIAYSLAESDALVCPLMDARRQQVYTGLYTVRDGSLRVIRPQCASRLEEILEDASARLAEMPELRCIVFLGDGVPVYRQRIGEVMERLGAPYVIAPPHLARQRAAATAALAEAYWKERGEACFTRADDFRPEYLRMSQAERERMEAERRQKEAESASAEAAERAADAAGTEP